MRRFPSAALTAGAVGSWPALTRNATRNLTGGSILRDSTGYMTGRLTGRFMTNTNKNLQCACSCGGLIGFGPK